MRQRSGATLIEVLVSIFVMGIGLIALLALFPVGALNMAQAIKDDRCALAGSNATAIAIARDLRNNFTLTSAFNNPNTGTAPITINAPRDGLSYAVYVDPIGVASYATPYSQWVGGAPLPPTPANIGIPRRSTSFTTSTATRLRNCALLDDLNFGTDGKPTSPVQRGAAFSWAYLVRRPQHGNAYVVELSVVVYHQRPLTFTSALAAAETLYDKCLPFEPGRPNVVTMNWDPTKGEKAPAVRSGSWILDATPVVLSRPGGVISSVGPGHAFFYRVLNVTDISATRIEVEVDKPIRVLPNRDNQNSTFIVMENVAEVFEKGTGWRP